jgi:electron transport complex protein RnfE
MENNYWKIVKDGIWEKNIVFSQMLALCPLLAVTGTATNGLGMGLATLAVMIATGLSIAVFRNLTTPEIRIPVFVLIIAAIVTMVDMAMNAWVHDLHKILGLFIPLIVTNCAILGRAEAFASKNNIIPSIVDGLMMGAGFTLALVIVGAVREIIGSGTLFANASLLLGSSFSFMELTIIPHYKGFLLMILPPGGFLVLGFLLAGKRLLDARAKRTKPAKESELEVDQKNMVTT